MNHSNHSFYPNLDAKRSYNQSPAVGGGSIAPSYDASAWPEAEAAGLVCLPAAGQRRGNYVYNVDDENNSNFGYYWSSSEIGYRSARCMNFDHWVFSTSSGNTERNYGHSVRLITEF